MVNWKGFERNVSWPSFEILFRYCSYLLINVYACSLGAYAAMRRIEVDDV
jgi:hypothetical protein